MSVGVNVVSPALLPWTASSHSDRVDTLTTNTQCLEGEVQCHCLCTLTSRHTCTPTPRVVGGLEVLSLMEKVETDEEDRPKVELLHSHLFCVPLFSSVTGRDQSDENFSVCGSISRSRGASRRDVSCSLSHLSLSHLTHNYILVESRRRKGERSGKEATTCKGEEAGVPLRRTLSFGLIPTQEAAPKAYHSGVGKYIPTLKGKGGKRGRRGEEEEEEVHREKGQRHPESSKKQRLQSSFGDFSTW